MPDKDQAAAAAAAAARFPPNGDWRPIPDPTLLTTQALLREIGGVRELYDSRLAAMDKAVALIQATVDKSPSIAELYAKYEEKFRGVQIQFDQRDIAVQAALQTAKEAVGEQNKSNQLAIAKSEASTIKQADQIGINIAALEKSMDDKFDDVKTRLTLIEGRSRGIGDSWGFVVGLVGLISAVAAIIALVLKH